MYDSPVLMRLMIACAAVVASAVAAGCSNPPQEPLKLEGNLLTVDNRSSQDWNAVEIWLNVHYRVTTKSIPAGGRFQVPLDAFVAGFGQRFDFRRAQITDLRLVAKLPDGKPLELKKPFEHSGLAGMLGGKSSGAGPPRKK
jgi:hypothetical protein